jgi:signal transduction histidine kinase
VLAPGDQSDAAAAPRATLSARTETHHERDSTSDSRPAYAALVAGLLLSAAYAVLPTSYVAVRELGLYTLVEVGAIVAIVVGVLRYRPAVAVAWLLAAVGLSLWMVGDVVWSAYALVDRDPFPSTADAFYLAGYPVLAAGLAFAARRSASSREPGTIFDAAIVALGLSVVAWILLVESYRSNEDLEPFPLGVSLAYVAGDVLLLGVAAQFLLRGMWRTWTFRVLAAALLLTLVGDAVFVLNVANRLPGEERFVSTALLVGILLYGVSALHPSMRQLTEPSAAHRSFGTRRLVLIAVACLLPTIAVVVQTLRGELLYVPVSIGAVLILTLLAVAAFWSLAADARKAAKRESILSEYAAALLRASGREELFALAEEAAGRLIGDGNARLVEPGERGHAFASPLTVQGRLVAELVTDARPSEVRPVRDSLGTIAAELALALDRERLMRIEREAAEALAEQNERLRELDKMKDQFVSTVSHELRTPLTSMVGYLEILLEGEAGELSEDQQRFLEIVNRSCDRLNRVIDDILVVARIDANRLSYEMQDVDLRMLTEEAVESSRMAAVRTGVDLRLSAPDEPVPAWADQTRLNQMLDNLLSNAIKFTPDGGSVSVTLARQRDVAVLQVSDTGIGVPEEEVGRLFDRFFRASTGLTISGTGLGLPIVKSIAEAHGGTIDVESEVGVGTTFTVELPLQSRSPVEETAEEEVAT